MANIIENDGRWGPISEGSGPIFELSYTGRQIVIDFDNSTTSGIHYTAPIGVPISTETEFIWNTEAVDCGANADMTIYWQGTDDPSVAQASYGGGGAISASDTGWTTSSAVATLTGSNDCDARTVVNLAGISSVVNKTYTRFKFVLATATPGDVDITCRVSPIPSPSKVTHSVAL